MLVTPRRCAQCGRRFRRGWRSAAVVASAASHSKHAEARRGKVLPPGQGERQSKNMPRVERIDDAIIPEARGRVVRMPLTLELLANRRLQPFFLELAEGASAALEGLALDGRQDAGGLLP